MASLSVLSATIRARLLANEPAPLPGFGTIRRVRVPARVNVQADGSRSLQPPRESIRLVLGPQPDPTNMASGLARRLNVSASAGVTALRDSIDQLEALLAAKGEVVLEGVGVLRRSDRGLLFGTDPALLSQINQTPDNLEDVRSESEPEEPEVIVAGPVRLAEPPPPAPADDDDLGYPTEPPEMAPLESATAASVPHEEDGPYGDGAFGDGYGDGQDDLADLDAFTIGGTFEEDEPSSLAASLREATEADSDSLTEASTSATSPKPLPASQGWITTGETSSGSGHPEASDADHSPTEAAEADAFTSGLAVSDETDDAVDDLLAGIWSTGAPSASHLGASPSPPTSPPAAEEPPSSWKETMTIDEWVSPEEPPPAEPASGSATTDESLLITARPDGLPHMPGGWSPDTPTAEPPYQPYDTEQEPERRRGFLLWAVLALLIVGLATAAFILWPRFAGGTADATPTAETAPSAATTNATDPALTDGDPGLTDDVSAETAPDTEAALDPDLPPAQVVTGVTPSPSGTSEAPGAATGAPGGSSASGATQGRIRSAPRAGGSLSRPTPPADNPLAPDLTGLSDDLAIALAGDAPIRLDGEGFTWVLVSLSNRDEAVEMVRRYQRAGFRANLIEGTLRGQPIYRVALGDFDSREDAYSVRDRLPEDLRGRDDIWTLNLADV
ncbi:MAG: SPOR domain-containing protein [Bacteroidota bacterium]